MTLDTLFCQLYFRGEPVTVHSGSTKQCCCCDNAAVYTAVGERMTNCGLIFMTSKVSTYHPLCHKHRESEIRQHAKPVVVAAAPREVKPLNPWIRSSICIAMACLPMACAVVTKLKPEPNNYFSPAYNPPLVFTPVTPNTGPSYAERHAKSAEETEADINRYRAKEIVREFRKRSK